MAAKKKETSKETVKRTRHTFRIHIDHECSLLVVIEGPETLSREQLVEISKELHQLTQSIGLG